MRRATNGVTVWYAGKGDCAARSISAATCGCTLTRVDYSIRCMEDINELRRILRDNRVIAVVGLSADWYRPSYFAAKYMLEHGYRVIPVNPKYGEVLGQKCYGSLRDIPGKVDLVDVFRKT